MEITSVADLKPGDRYKNIEVKVYRRWISNIPPETSPIGYCCILLDRLGNVIQATMSFKDMDYFYQVMELQSAYRISDFSCEHMKAWQQTLSNPTTLRFGRFTKFKPIPNDDFPIHHFKFVSYNQLPSRLAKNSLLIDYIGCVRSVGELTEAGDPNRNLSIRRTLNIENLNGKVVELTMWGDMAEAFDVEAYNSLMKPVIIVISSCRVTKYNDLQLSSTSATHYYLNPDIPEVEFSFNQYKALYDTNPPLPIQRKRCDNREAEKMRNKFPLSTLLRQNPDAYKFVRFTCKGTVIDLSSTREWYHHACTYCPKKLTEGISTFECRDHGPQQEPKLRYCIKGIVSDGSAKALFTFFSPCADSLIQIECKKLVTELQNPNPYKLPPQIESIKGQEHIFQFHINHQHKKGMVDFVLDDILDDNIVVDKYQSELPASPSAITKRIASDESEKSETKKHRPGKSIAEETLT